MRAMARVLMAGVLLVLAAAGAAAVVPDAAAPAARPVPDGCWDLAESARIESALDDYFAATSDRERHRRYVSALANLPSGLSEAELRAMAEVEPGAGQPQHLRTERQRIQGHGVFTLAVPAHYDPGHACALVVALHGADSDGDSLVPDLNDQLTAAGTMVLYPTISVPGERWESPDQLAEVLSLIEWVSHRYRIDFRRIAVVGCAMGGMGVWSYAASHPELWNAAAPVASRPTLQGVQELERLRGVPLCALHGALDSGAGSIAPLEAVRAAVAAMTERGMAAQVLEVPQCGHLLPAAAWTPLVAWLLAQPPKASSPRPLLLPGPGQPSASQLVSDPLGLDGPDPALALIRQDRAAEARQLLTQRLLHDPSRLTYLYLALAEVPALNETIPSGAGARFFRSARGWGEATEHAALGDLQHAISADRHPSPEFLAVAYLWAAKIHAKRFLLLVPQGGVGWVGSYNAFVSCITQSTRAQPGNREASDLALEILQHLPPALQLAGAQR